MAGLNSDEVKEVMDYVNKYNSIEHINKKSSKRRKIVKYVNFSMDTRDGNIWAVTFTRVFESDVVTLTGADLKEQVYKWLDTPDI